MPASPSVPCSGPPSSPRWLRVVSMLVIYGVLHAGYRALHASEIGETITHVSTVAPAAALIGVLLPADGVQAHGTRLAWPGGRLTLLSGCDGFDVISLYVAAVLSADLPWRRGAAVLALGVALAWLLNQLRIAALYASFRRAPEWFDPIHTVWGPLLLVACVALIFCWALRRSRRPDAPAG